MCSLHDADDAYVGSCVLLPSESNQAGASVYGVTSGSRLPHFEWRRYRRQVDEHTFARGVTDDVTSTQWTERGSLLCMRKDASE